MPADGPSLDYTFFKERVQPIFLQKRPGHARCVTCHIASAECSQYRGDAEYDCCSCRDSARKQRE